MTCTVAVARLLALILLLGFASSAQAGTVPPLPTAIQDEGSTSNPARPFWNFVGTGVTVTDDAGNNRKNITIPGVGNASILGYGAIGDDPGDGSGTDNSVAIQAALTAACAIEGAIGIPDQKFRVNEYVSCGLQPPAITALTVGSSGGSLLSATTYYYKIAAGNATGQTYAAGDFSVNTGGAGNDETITLDFREVVGATGPNKYCIYGRAAGDGTDLISCWNGSAWSPAGGAGSDSNTFVDTGSITPSGNHPTTSSTGGNSISIQGEGPGVSELIFTAGAEDGLVLSVDSVNDSIVVKGLTLRTNQAGVQRSLLSTYCPLGGDGGVGHQLLIADVEITTTDAAKTTAYPQYGWIGQNCWNANLQNFTTLGRYTATAPTLAIPDVHAGMRLTGMTDAKCVNCTSSQWDYGIATTGDLAVLATGNVNPSEGFNCANCYVLYVNVGVYAKSDSQEPLLVYCNSHTNAETYGFYIENRREVDLCHGDHYKESTAGQNWVFAQLNNCEYCTVSYNFVTGSGTGTETGVSFGTFSGSGSTHNEVAHNRLNFGDGGGLIAADGNAGSNTAVANKMITGTLFVSGTTEGSFWIYDNLPGIPQATLTGADYGVQNGSRQYCSDCAQSTADGACGGGSSGLDAMRSVGSWTC